MKGNNEIILSEVDMRDVVERGLVGIFQGPIIVHEVEIENKGIDGKRYHITISQGPIVE